MNMSGLITFRSLHRLITWGAFSILPAMFAANGPPAVVPPVNQPVEVVVKNTAAAAVQVEDINNPAFQPFRKQLFMIISAGLSGAEATFQVPAGKRLVIEFVSFSYILPLGQNPTNSIIFPESVNFQFSAPLQGRFNAGNLFVGTSPTRLYCDPGSEVRILAQRNANTESGQATVSISGYYVNVP